MMRYEFVTKIHPSLPRQGGVYISLPNFDANFTTVMAVWEARQAKNQGPKIMKSFAETNKAKKVKGGQEAVAKKEAGQKAG